MAVITPPGAPAHGAFADRRQPEIPFPVIVGGTYHRGLRCRGGGCAAHNVARRSASSAPWSWDVAISAGLVAGDGDRSTLTAIASFTAPVFSLGSPPGYCDSG